MKTNTAATAGKKNFGEPAYDRRPGQSLGQLQRRSKPLSRSSARTPPPLVLPC